MAVPAPANREVAANPEPCEHAAIAGDRSTYALVPLRLASIRRNSSCMIRP
jgi:hypothetical protein